MKNALDRLLDLKDSEKEQRGIVHTPLEISRQTEYWPDTARRVEGVRSELLSLMETMKRSIRPFIYLSGAGTSEFIGYCLDGLFRSLYQVPAAVFPTPLIVTNPAEVFVPQATPLLVSFARSGNSPESIGAFLTANQFSPDFQHLVITCNEEGNLARLAEKNQHSLCLTLDKKTNDHGLAMTASFSNMVIAGQGAARIADVEPFSHLVDRLVSAGNHLLSTGPDILEELCQQDFDRAVFLGNGCNRGTAVESHLKLQELTAGQVMCAWDTFLGLRHGPEAVINQRTLVVAFLSSDPLTRQYEQELLAELREKRLGQSIIIVGAQPEKVIRDQADVVLDFDPAGDLQIPDSFTPPVMVIAGQLLGLFKSLSLGLKPDAPSEAGTINRVVKGVNIYDAQAFREQGIWSITAKS